jgi:D-alanyl-D-alanine carboxypeptidase/lipoprotein-anchoring transpeptidase ErfK/SrfK
VRVYSTYMVTDELKGFVSQSIASGVSASHIRATLSDTGWGASDIEEVFRSLGITEPVPTRSIMHRIVPQKVVYGVLASVILVLGGTTSYLFVDRFDLSKTNEQEVRDFYTRLSNSKISFTDTGDMVFPDEQKFLTKKSALIANRESFVEVDLRAMQVTLYDQGKIGTMLPVLSKGKEGSWWETPTGDYKVLAKTVSGYSAIGNVWMPYSIQFYGNYLMHGWPAYEDGTPVPQGFSGGCIRLSDADAKVVYEFVKLGTPILVLENYTPLQFGTLTLKQEPSSSPTPSSLTAKAFLIQNLASGETLLEHHVDDLLPVASLTKLMTAVVAHEVIYLGRSIRTVPKTVAAAGAVFQPFGGEKYIGLDLMYPLLMQSSNAVADMLAAYIGTDTFVKNMNGKATSLQMVDTRFVDPSGVGAENVSTADDIAKLLQYIYFKRPFLFDITKGVVFDRVGAIPIGDTIPVQGLQNFNEFANEKDLIGMKNGQTGAARQTLASVWNLQTPEGDVPVGIIVLGSDDRKKDTQLLLDWVKNTYAVY